MDRFLIKLPSSNTIARTCSKKRKREVVISRGKPQGEQMFLDIGQKIFGKNSACSKCGMIYVEGQSDDEQRHKIYCRKVSNIIHIDHIFLQNVNEC